jgi:hypothetical protein
MPHPLSIKQGNLTDEREAAFARQAAHQVKTLAPIHVPSRWSLFGFCDCVSSI